MRKKFNFEGASVLLINTSPAPKKPYVGAQIKQMPYLDQILEEAARKYSPDCQWISRGLSGCLRPDEAAIPVLHWRGLQHWPTELAY